MKHTKILITFITVGIFLSACTQKPIGSNIRNKFTNEIAKLQNNIDFQLIVDEKQNVKNSIQPLDASDFLVRDSIDSVILDYPYDDFIFSKPELIIENNYVGEDYVGEYIYKNYMHEYEDLMIFTSNRNYNLKNRDFNEYYITQITLKNSTFTTPRGITIGSSMDEVIKAYGIGIESMEDEAVLYYIFNDMQIKFKFNNNQIVNYLVLYISI